MHDWNDHPHGGDRRWRKMDQAFRRFRGFPGMGGFPDWQGLEGNLRIGRMLASGDLRLVALYLIEQQPRHGYDLIKAIEEKTGGFYSPSPGVIYPALTFLEEAGYVTSTSEGNKRLYTITEEGKAHLADNRAAVEATLAHLGKIGEQFAKVRKGWEDAERNFREPPHRPDRDMDDVPPEVNEARKDLKHAIREMSQSRNPDDLHRLADILRRAANEIRNGPPRPRDGEIDI